MLRASGPTGQTFAEWYRLSGRADVRPQCRTHTGRATNRASAHVPNKTPSGAQNPDRRGLDFDGNVLEIRSSRRTTACWRSWYAAPLRRSSLCSGQRATDRAVERTRVCSVEGARAVLTKTCSGRAAQRDRHLPSGTD